MSDWAEDRAKKFIMDYNNDPLRNDDVTPLAAMLREVASTDYVAARGTTEQIEAHLLADVRRVVEGVRDNDFGCGGACGAEILSRLEQL